VYQFVLCQFVQDSKGIASSSEKVRYLLDEECSLIDSKHIVLGGFSQGAAMSLYTG
jgi:predicted esterase